MVQGWTNAEIAALSYGVCRSVAPLIAGRGKIPKDSDCSTAKDGRAQALSVGTLPTRDIPGYVTRGTQYDTWSMNIWGNILSILFLFHVI